MRSETFGRDETSKTFGEKWEDFFDGVLFGLMRWIIGPFVAVSAIFVLVVLPVWFLIGHYFWRTPTVTLSMSQWQCTDTRVVDGNETTCYRWERR